MVSGFPGPESYRIWRTLSLFFLLMLTAAGLSFSIQMPRGTWGLVSWSGIELRPPVLGVSSLNHWTPWKVPGELF